MTALTGFAVLDNPAATAAEPAERKLRRVVSFIAITSGNRVVFQAIPHRWLAEAVRATGALPKWVVLPSNFEATQARNVSGLQAERKSEKCTER